MKQLSRSVFVGFRFVSMDEMNVHCQWTNPGDEGILGKIEKTLCIYS